MAQPKPNSPSFKEFLEKPLPFPVDKQTMICDVIAYGSVKIAYMSIDLHQSVVINNLLGEGKCLAQREHVLFSYWLYHILCVFPFLSPLVCSCSHPGCSKSYTLKQNLRKHEKSHNNPLPYKVVTTCYSVPYCCHGYSGSLLPSVLVRGIIILFAVELRLL